jgi:hypothetical protein
MRKKKIIDTNDLGYSQKLRIILNTHEQRLRKLENIFLNFRWTDADIIQAFESGAHSSCESGEQFLQRYIIERNKK